MMLSRNKARAFYASWVVGCLIVGATAGAQRIGDPIFEITVVAPRLVRQEVGRTASGSKIELISLTRRVSYEDLDLTMQADVTELEKRINDTAKEACTQLAAMYPLSAPNTPDCVETAVDQAMVQAQEAIAAAK